MSVDELNDRLGKLLAEARALQTDIANGEPDAEMAVALGALSAVVVVLASLLDTMLDVEASEPAKKGLLLS